MTNTVYVGMLGQGQEELHTKCLQYDKVLRNILHLQ